ncbi:hypothetical protein [Halomonas mongoliensis]|uniref:hypothetical protein n=1 Tax=Halomonas mongoliensis TaxID=321265 RepID=UPI00403AFB63
MEATVAGVLVPGSMPANHADENHCQLLLRLMNPFATHPTPWHEVSAQKVSTQKSPGGAGAKVRIETVPSGDSAAGRRAA